MKNSTLLNYLIFGYVNTVKDKSYKPLYEELVIFEAENKNKELSEFANELKTNFPQFDILHDYFLRSKLNKIESHLNTTSK